MSYSMHGIHYTTMYSSTNIFTFFFLIGSVAVRTLDIPPFLKICHRNNPNLNECVKRSIDLLKPYLKTGIPTLQIPPCEPLRVPRIEINQLAGPVSIRSIYTDIEVQGGTSFILKSVKVDIDNNRVRLKIYLPRLEMNAHYNMEGKILMLPIKGNGLARGNFTDIDVIATIQGERYQSRKTGETHYRVTDLYVDFDIRQANIHLDNLFNGDSTLSNAMNLFLNDNWDIVKAEMKPALENTVSEIFKYLCPPWTTQEKKIFLSNEDMRRRGELVTLQHFTTFSLQVISATSYLSVSCDLRNASQININVNYCSCKNKL